MKPKTVDFIGTVLTIIIFTALIGLGIWWEWYKWQDCRSNHSFGYCLMTLTD